MNKYIRNVKQLKIFIRRANLYITRRYATLLRKHKIKRFRQRLRAYSLKSRR